MVMMMMVLVVVMMDHSIHTHAHIIIVRSYFGPSLPFDEALAQTPGDCTLLWAAAGSSSR